MRRFSSYKDEAEYFNGLDLMVSLSRFGGLTVRPWAASLFQQRTGLEMRYSFSKPSQPKRLLFGKLFGAADPA
jgi:hypothetical protein